MGAQTVLPDPSMGRYWGLQEAKRVRYCSAAHDGPHADEEPSAAAGAQQPGTHPTTEQPVCGECPTQDPPNEAMVSAWPEFVAIPDASDSD